ncbi:hypothetical protein MferCBS31731_001967 [Microsporum ferrugineum]
MNYTTSFGGFQGEPDQYISAYDSSTSVRGLFGGLRKPTITLKVIARRAESDETDNTSLLLYPGILCLLLFLHQWALSNLCWQPLGRQFLGLAGGCGGCLDSTLTLNAERTEASVMAHD